MSKVASCVVALLPPTSEVGENIIGLVLWEHIQWFNRDIFEIEHPQFSLLFGDSIHLYHTTRHPLPFDERDFFPSLPSGVDGLCLYPQCCLVLGM
jgi:hypothetical protein